MRVGGLGIGLKWAPDDAVLASALGSLSVGVEGGAFWSRNPAESWRADNLAVAALASLEIAPSLTVSANLGTTRSFIDHNLTTGARLGVGWQASERWLLFVEALVADHGGIDLVASRYTGNSASVSLGLGWYGLRLP